MADPDSNRYGSPMISRQSVGMCLQSLSDLFVVDFEICDDQASVGGFDRVVIRDY